MHLLEITLEIVAKLHAGDKCTELQRVPYSPGVNMYSVIPSSQKKKCVSTTAKYPQNQSSLVDSWRIWAVLLTHSVGHAVSFEQPPSVSTDKYELCSQSSSAVRTTCCAPPASSNNQARRFHCMDFFKPFDSVAQWRRPSSFVPPGGEGCLAAHGFSLPVPAACRHSPLASRSFSFQIQEIFGSDLNLY